MIQPAAKYPVEEFVDVAVAKNQEKLNFGHVARLL